MIEKHQKLTFGKMELFSFEIESFRHAFHKHFNALNNDKKKYIDDSQREILWMRYIASGDVCLFAQDNSSGLIEGVLRLSPIEDNRQANSYTMHISVNKNRHEDNVMALLLKNARVHMNSKDDENIMFEVSTINVEQFLGLIAESTEISKTLEMELDLNKYRFDTSVTVLPGIDGIIFRSYNCNRLCMNLYEDLLRLINYYSHNESLGNPKPDLSIDDLMRFEDKFGKAGFQRILVLAIDQKTEEVIGFSEAIFKPSGEAPAKQLLTVVNNTYRCIGVATRLKMGVIHYLLEKYPTIEKILTTVSSVNQKVIGLNEKLGFVVYESNSLYQIDRKGINNFTRPKKEWAD